MSKEEHFRKLEKIFHEGPVNKIFKPVLKVGYQTAVVEMAVRPDYFHAGNAMHGAFYFKMLDDAAFFAANSVVEDVLLLTSSFNIHFLRPVNSGKIKAVGNLKFISKNLLMAEAQLLNDRDKEIGFGTGTFMKSKVLLEEMC